MASSPVAYITGGASGIGLAASLHYLLTGYKIHITDLQPNGTALISAAILTHLNTTSPEFNPQGRWSYSIADVARWEQQEVAFKDAVERYGRIDIVVPCAGVGERRWMEKVDAGESGRFVRPDLKVIDVNVTGVLFTTSLGIQQFMRQGIKEDGIRGRIILIASICGLYAIPHLPVYTAAKHALFGFTKSYAPSLQPSKILINAICPAVVRTAISSDVFYAQLDEQGLLTPMATILTALDQLSMETKASGECWECGNEGITARKGNGVEYAGEKTRIACELLEKRAEGLFDP